MSQHFYNESGDLVTPGTEGAYPSPSTVLDIIANPELDSWRKRVGLEAADEHMISAQERGTRVHKQCERWLAGKSVDFETIEEIDMFIGFQNWAEKHKPEIIASELFVISERYHYAGTTDLVVLLDGELWIIDLKTGADRPQHKLQLRAYEQAYFEMSGKHARMGVLGLTEKNKCGYRKLKEYDEPLESWLLHLATFNWWHKFRKIQPTKAIVGEAIWRAE